MLWSERIINWLHKLPHLSYRFKIVKDPFNIDINGAYIQSLVVFCGFSLLLALLFLLGIVITWICQCCFKKSDHVHSRRHIRHLSTALFLISVICFILLGGCLYGNEHTNKSITSSGTAFADFNQNIRLTVDQAQKLNTTQMDASLHLEELTGVIEQKSKRMPDINQTLLREADDVLTEISDKIDQVKQVLATIAQMFVDLKFMDRFSYYGDRMEFERWILCLTLLAIMITVLFAGVIAFCRQSRKGAIIFSGLGIVIFLVSWLLFSLVFPLTIAYADFCANGRPFLRSRINDAILETFEFYKNCAPQTSTKYVIPLPADVDDSLPPNIPIHEINNFYTKIEEDQQKLDGLLYTLFNHTQEIENVTRLISGDISKSFKSIGALESTLSCSNIHRDVYVMYNGFCNQGFLGFAIVSTSLFFLGIFLFILLILVSRSWHIFIRTPADYVEVGEDDHFSPRNHEMPDNVYDTNLFNPRARQFNGVVDTNGSILNGIPETIGNGSILHQTTTHLNNHSSNSASPLLMNGGGGALDGGTTLTDTWLRGGGVGNGGLLSNGGYLASAPPASNTIGSQNRNSNNYYRLSNNGYRSHYHQPNTDFQEQYDI